MAQAMIAPAPVEEGPRPLRWTRAEYHRMAEVGLLPEGPGTELIDGHIYVKMPQGRAHRFAARALVAALRAVFAEGFDVNAQFPLPLGDNEPEPDVLVLRGAPRDYDGRDPDPQMDVVLAAEVSDSSLSVDRDRKARLYASFGIPEYWIVNLPGRTIEVRLEPRMDGYAAMRIYAEGESVPVGDGAVAVADVLPKVA